jgi:hypothetical protein
MSNLSLLALEFQSLIHERLDGDDERRFREDDLPGEDISSKEHASRSARITFSLGSFSAFRKIGVTAQGTG